MNVDVSANISPLVSDNSDGLILYMPIKPLTCMTIALLVTRI